MYPFETKIRECCKEIIVSWKHIPGWEAQREKKKKKSVVKKQKN